MRLSQTLCIRGIELVGSCKEDVAVANNPLLINDGSVSSILLALDNEAVTPAIHSVVEIDLDDQPALLMVAGEQATHLPQTTSSLDCEGQTTARARHVTEKTK